MSCCAVVNFDVLCCAVMCCIRVHVLHDVVTRHVLLCCVAMPNVCLHNCLMKNGSETDCSADCDCSDLIACLVEDGMQAAA